MKKERLISTGGYDIPCVHTLTGNEKTVLIVSHGFGSSKESSTAQMLAQKLPAQGIGVLAYDFPAHGDSPVDGEQLTVDRCLSDLAAAERYVRSAVPGAEIGYFGSSFGAYITLLYLAGCPHAGKKAFLRSAAVEMPLMFRHKTPEEERELAEQGFIEFGAQFGYVRPLKLTPAFFDSLNAHDVFVQWKRDAGKLCMIHGDADQVASYEAARRFAVQSGAQLLTVAGGDHRLSVPGAPEKVAEAAAAFLLRG